jgi:RNA polymerase sigma-70 factor (ECF subfamily)
MTLMEQAMTRLRDEQRAAGTQEQFNILSTLLLEDTHSAKYSDVAQQLTLSANAVAAAVYRLRKRYRHLVRAEIAQTVAGPAEVDAELKDLLAAISG